MNTVRALGVLLAVLLLAGCSFERVGPPAEHSAGQDAGSPTSSEQGSPAGPVDLEVPLDLARVTPSGSVAASTTALPDPEGFGSLTVEPPFLRITHLDGADVRMQDNAGWGIALSLTDEDARVFGNWTTDHVGERVAVIADGEVIFAPQVASPITGGEITIAGKYTQKSANELLAKLVGR
jgi:SecD-like export protein